MLVLALYALHQDIWNWRVVQPVVLGVLPIGLFYHVIYTLAVAVVMWLLVRLAWPGHLEDGIGENASGAGQGTDRDGGGR